MSLPCSITSHLSDRPLVEADPLQLDITDGIRNECFNGTTFRKSSVRLECAGALRPYRWSNQAVN